MQAWRGYHRCQVAWSLTSVSGDLGLGSDVQLSCLLLLYLPRRGLIEVSTWHLRVIMTSSVLSQVWSPDNKSKVTEFHVSKQGKE